MCIGITETFKVFGLHQGSALSPFLFTGVFDVITEEVRKEPPWTVMFADHIVITLRVDSDYRLSGRCTLNNGRSR